MKKVFYNDQSFRVPPEVYKPAEDTYLLADNLEIVPGDRVLELGTGCGLISIIAAKSGAKVVATDINPKAVECAEENAENHGVADKIEFRRGNLFRPVYGERFDLIIFNPPYLPVPDRELSSEGIETAWSGGADGRKIIDSFLNQFSNYLDSDGRAMFVQSSLSDVQKTFKVLNEKGFSIQTKSKKLSFEELYLFKCLKSVTEQASE